MINVHLPDCWIKSLKRERASLSPSLSPGTLEEGALAITDWVLKLCIIRYDISHLCPLIYFRSHDHSAQSWKGGSSNCIPLLGGPGLGMREERPMSSESSANHMLMSCQQKSPHPLFSQRTLLEKALRILKSCFDKTKVLF